MGRLTTRRHVIEDPCATLGAGQLVMTDQELRRFTRNRIIGSFAETGRIRFPPGASGTVYSVSVVWNFSHGTCPPRHLRAVRIVPAGTPGAIEAWVDPLPRFEVRRNADDDPVLIGFSDSPKTASAEERRVDRWHVAELCSCPGRCQPCHTAGRT